MGFDNECILNIQSLAGEYFCPVCRLLVVPNEALQSQCTHLYCKPCLAYIANSTKACPYDGYLVTEADSKPLIESNKPLAETINKIAVHCLYHRSGCTWQGPLSECVTHCSGCVFGNSPVVCNRCGTQIVHRQVQEHAQACPGVQPQAQQAGVSQGASAAAKAVTDQSHNVNQAGVASTQVQTAQSTAAAVPAQDPNQQASAGIQAQAVSQAAVTTSDQWYQQQYSQYYQQYPGYYPYQQQYQQYYPYQQQAVLQPQLYVQSQAQPQSQVQPQPQPQVQPQPQPQVQPQPQPQPQPQVQPQAQTQLQPQTLPPTQVQAQQHVHAVSVPQAQNPQQQVIPVAHQQSQNPPSQPAFYPQGQSQATPQQYPVQSFSQQHMQTPYQQPQVQMQYPNLQNQQGYSQLQPQPNPNLQSQAPPSAQPLVQASHPQGQQHLPPPPPVANQPVVQPLVQTSHPVTGYHSYPQAQASQQIQSGAPQQNPVNIRPQQSSQQPTQMHGQFSQSSAHVRPPQHAPIPNQQQPGLVPAPAQGPNVPAAQQQPMFPYNQQSGNLAQPRPPVLPIQPHVPQPYGQQHQPPSVQQSGPPQSQTYSLTPFGQQQIPMQPQLQSQGPTQPTQLQHAAYPRPQQSVMGSFGSHPSHQSQNLVGRPVVPNQGVLSQAGSIPVKPMQPGYNQNNLISSGSQIVGTSSEQQPDAILHMGRTVTEQQVDTPIGKIEKIDVSSTAVTGTGEMKAAKSQHGSQTGEDKSIEANRAADGISLEKGGLPLYQTGKEALSMKEQTDGRLVEAVDRDEKFGSTISSKGQEQQAAAPKDKGNGSSDRIFQVQETEFSQGHAPNIQKDIQEKGQQDRNLPHAQSTSFGQRVDNSRGFPPHGQLHVGGMIQSSQPDAIIDKGRHQPLMLQYGQSPHQQRPPAPMLQATPPGPQYGSPGFGQLLPGIRSPPKQFQPQAFNRPPGPETFPGIMPGNGLPTSYVKAGQGPQSIPPQGPHVPAHLLSSRKSQDELGLLPGVVDESNRMMGLKPLHGPEGEPFNKRSLYADDRSSHPLNSIGSGPLGRPSGMHPDMVTMQRPPGMDPSSTFGHPDERLKSLQNERMEPLSMEPSRHIHERRGFEEDMKHFGRPHDMDPDPFHRSGRFFPSGSPFDRHPLDKAFHPAGPEGGPGSAVASSRIFPPHSHGNLFGETAFGPPEEDRGRFDSSRMHGPGRARMDNLSSRSPGREYPSFPSRGFGGFGNDIERREPHMPGDPAHFRRGEFEGPGHMRMGDHPRNDDLISRDFAPKNIRRGELLGPRDLPSHMQIAEHGGLHGPAHIGESYGPDLFGGNRMGHSRFGDPRFRSTFYPGDLELADNSRKRKVASMGWCRICNVDCETVEGLDLHSQTREHQKVAMDMVLSIKQQNAKKQKVGSSGKTSAADLGKSRTIGVEARGNKK